MLIYFASKQVRCLTFCGGCVGIWDLFCFNLNHLITKKNGGNSLHPIEIIELMIVGGIILVILLASFILKGKWRKIIKVLAILFLVSFGIFYYVRPYWIDMQIEKKVGYIQIHLEEQYPGET